MKVTAIKRQQKNPNRFSVYLDNKYGFSLDQNQLIELGVKIGIDINQDDIKDFKKSSEHGKLIDKTLRYLSVRRRSKKELIDYLKRKTTSDTQISKIIKKMKGWGYVDDEKFAQSWISDKRDLKQRSNRRLRFELFQKGVEKEIVDRLLNDSSVGEKTALKSLIAKKIKLVRYQDRDKITNYLLRQGFNYSDIRTELDASFRKDEK